MIKLILILLFIILIILIIILPAPRKENFISYYNLRDDDITNKEQVKRRDAYIQHQIRLITDEKEKLAMKQLELTMEYERLANEKSLAQFATINNQQVSTDLSAKSTQTAKQTEQPTNNLAPSIQTLQTSQIAQILSQINTKQPACPQAKPPNINNIISTADLSSIESRMRDNDKKLNKLNTTINSLYLLLAMSSQNKKIISELKDSPLVQQYDENGRAIKRLDFDMDFDKDADIDEEGEEEEDEDSDEPINKSNSDEDEDDEEDDEEEDDDDEEEEDEDNITAGKNQGSTEISTQPTETQAPIVPIILTMPPVETTPPIVQETTPPILTEIPKETSGKFSEFV